MATVMKNLVRALAVGGFAGLFFLSCQLNLPLKAIIKGLAFPNPTNVKITTPGDKTFKISWVDPADKDVDHIEISFNTPFATISPPPSQNVSLGVQKQTVNVPLNNVWYLITVKAVYKSGDKSVGITPFNIFNNQLPYTQRNKLTEDYYYQPASASPSSHGINDSGTTYTYNSDGTLATTTSYSYSTGSAVQSGHATYTYTNGRLQREDHYNDPGSTNSSYTTYQYDFQGNMTQQSTFYWNGVSAFYLSYNVTYQYDSSGNQTAVYSYDYNSSGTLTYSYGQGFQYDVNGHVVKEIEYDGSGNTQFVFAIDWDPSTNFPSKFSFYDASGTLTGYETITVAPGSLSFIEYNASGVQTGAGSNNFNSFGLETSSSSAGSTSSDTWNYDIDGNITKQIYYSAPSVIGNVYEYTY